MQFCWCALQEGLPFLLPHLTKQLLRLGLDDFLRLLQEKNLPLPTAGRLLAAPVASASAEAGNGTDAQHSTQDSHQARAASGQALLSTPEVLEQLQHIKLGGAVAVLEQAVAANLGLATQEASGALTANAPLAVAVWRTPASLSVLVPKIECEQMADKIEKALQRNQQKQQPEQPTAQVMQMTTV